MARYFWLVITVILMLALPLLVPAEHRGLIAMIVWSFGLAVVSYLGYPQPKRGNVYADLSLELAQSALVVEKANVARLQRNLDAQVRPKTTITLGDDPRIETVYWSRSIDRPGSADHHSTQNPDVLIQWVREGRKVGASTALRTSDGSLYFLREGAPVDLITNLVR